MFDQSSVYNDKEFTEQWATNSLKLIVHSNLHNREKKDKTSIRNIFRLKIDKYCMRFFSLSSIKKKVDQSKPANSPKSMIKNQIARIELENPVTPTSFRFEKSEIKCDYQ